MDAPAYRLDGVVVRFGERTVLEVPKLEITSGRTTAVVGPNGAGKTTLLRVLGLLVAPTEGRIEFFGRSVPARERERGRMRHEVTLLAQSPFLFHRSVRDNVAWGLRARGRLAGARVEAALDEVGLAGFGPRPAWKLSAGESQRVALARALAIDPPVLLLDEPTASVDREHVPRIEETIARLRASGKSIVLVTHDLEQAYRLADPVLSLVDGRIATVSWVNQIRGRVVRGDDAVRLDAGTLAIELAADPGTDAATVAIAPEEIVVSTEALYTSAGNALHGRIVRAVEDERGLLLTVDCGQPIVARVTLRSYRELGLNLGEHVWLTFKSSAVRWLEPAAGPWQGDPGRP